jgi:hypothetical protein
MAGRNRTGHSVEGIMRWGTAGRWADAWEETVAAHLGDALEDRGHPLEDLPDLLGEEHFANVMGGIFEDFLATSFDDRDPDNVVDDYLEHRGWKESAATRRYLTAIRDSAIGLFAVVGCDSGESFEVQDILGGGPPIRVFDRLCAQSVEVGDRLSLRLIEEGERIGMAGSSLVFDEEGCERLKEEIGALVEEAIATVEEIAGDETAEDPDFAVAIAREAILMQSAALFSEIWLERTLGSMDGGDMPELPAAPRLDPPREEQDAILGQFLDRHYRTLIDQPIPVLDGQTLRQAAAAKAGREKAVLWLEQAEDNERHRIRRNGGEPYDFGWMWTELGLKRSR